VVEALKGERRFVLKEISEKLYIIEQSPHQFPFLYKALIIYQMKVEAPLLYP